MSKRQNIVRHDSKEVQGEGSYVDMRSFTMGQFLEFSALAKANPSNFVAEQFAIKTTFVEWNWQDDEGKPLPSPADEAGFALLSLEEMRFLVHWSTARREQPGAKN